MRVCIWGVGHGQTSVTCLSHHYGVCVIDQTFRCPQRLEGKDATMPGRWDSEMREEEGSDSVRKENSVRRGRFHRPGAQ